MSIYQFYTKQGVPERTKIKSFTITLMNNHSFTLLEDAYSAVVGDSIIFSCSLYIRNNKIKKI